MNLRRGLTYTLALVSSGLASAAPAAAPGPKLTLAVDATDAPRRVLHATETIPVSGKTAALLYAKWIPGEHGPTGPITDLTGLRFSAGGKTLTWHRDPVEMYEVDVDLPAGATSITADFDYLSPAATGGFSSGSSGSGQLVMVSWNQVVLYPKGPAAADITVAPSLKLPAGWKYGTALEATGEGATTTFAPVSLERLVDSPVLAGAHVRVVAIGEAPRHRVVLASDSDEALDVKPELVDGWKRLVNETGALFGARHYRHYDFLVTLSDLTAHFGLEHHESSDDRIPERAFVMDDLRKLHAGLLPHEFVHSWNGKFRRPAGLASPDYMQPMKGELLWVYEGLTEYLGTILTARSGLGDLEDVLDGIARTAAYLDHESGRSWRPLGDTAVAAQLLYNAPPAGSSWRRGVDFYAEMVLVWLEADTTIRKLTNGQKSLDDFCKKFHGGQGGQPEVVFYSREDVEKALNEIAPYDWHGFFVARVDSIEPRAPLGGIIEGGWKLVYTDKIAPTQKAGEELEHDVSEMFTIGVTMKDNGTIIDVVRGMAGDKAGLAPGMRIVAVNRRAFSRDGFRDALKTAKGKKEPISLLAQNGEYYDTYKLDYHDGLRFPHLERDKSKPDVLGEILKAHAK